ncbi:MULTISPECIES: FAD-dependent monooxygenase [Streptomyces]|uniref:FAD-dependent monooxygenase n=1 Tax=Streptomyces TaxID=1883 RepID=UPI001B378190|nr:MULTISPECIES: FAD-dependent monooxygenase [unclassified Streptomyces]MBQ0883086.1 FAD-dependent monooxygenase [Streptomyces sp. RT42]
MAKGAIVVGAGPVGLMLAGELRLGGVDVVVYDKLPAPSGESRGLGFTSRTAEVLDQRGLLDELGEFRWGRHGHFGGVRIDFTLLEESHFGVMGLAQSRTEQLLGDWTARLGVPVLRGREVTGFEETEDGVVVRYDGPDGPGEDHAQYLIGCDGGRSTVRRLAGIAFPGDEATRGMYLADVTGADIRPRPIGERVEGGGMVLSVGLGDGYDRIVIHEPGVRPHHGEGTLTFTEVADAWQRMTGESIHHGHTRWMTALTNATGLAEQYRSGRVLLAGDAAHDHAPLGAQGVSVGLQDAVNLGWKLAATINGWAPDGLLDTYHAERHPLGEQLLRNVHAQSLLYLSGEEMEPLRAVMRELVRIPDAARYLAGQVSGLHIRYDVGAGEHPLLGLRLPPQRALQRADGTRVRVAELLHEARGVLIATGDPSTVHKTAADWSDRVDVVAGTWAEDGGPEAVLLRPDGHVVWAAPDGGDVTDALTRWFGAAAV